MIKPEWHFMKDKPRLCSCIKKYEECCGKEEKGLKNTSITSDTDFKIIYNYNDKD